MIAPAGHGKTTTLAQSLDFLCKKENKPILVLTHTHAGVASIKKKCSSFHLGSQVEITTISGFIQKIVLAFDGKLPSSDNQGRPDFNKILKRGIAIVRLRMVQEIIGRTYSHVLADEHQDCSYAQHAFISLLARNLPLHLFADPLQEIFNFKKDRMVDFANDCKNYKIFNCLTTPWRWYQSGNSRILGDTLTSLRLNLENSQAIDFTTLKGVVFHCADSNTPRYWAEIHNEVVKLKSSSLLLLFPNGFQYQIDIRAQKRTQFDYTREFTLLESIDDKTFYRCAKIVDCLLGCNDFNEVYCLTLNLLYSLSFNKGDIDNWFNDKGVKVKRSQADKIVSLYLCDLIDSLKSNDSKIDDLCRLIKFFRYNLKYFPKRPEVLNSILKILKIKSADTMYDRMVSHRDQIRVLGRNIEGKCVGSTLLTKGLEFDDVIVIDAHNILDKNNLYVALTRASKRLIIYSKEAIWYDKSRNR